MSEDGDHAIVVYDMDDGEAGFVTLKRVLEKWEAFGGVVSLLEGRH